MKMEQVLQLPTTASTEFRTVYLHPCSFFHFFTVLWFLLFPLLLFLCFDFYNWAFQVKSGSDRSDRVLILGKRTVTKPGYFGAYILRGAHHGNEQGQFRVDGETPGWHWDSWGWDACGYFRRHVNRDLNVEKEAGRQNFVELYRDSIQGWASQRVLRYRLAWSAWEKQKPACMAGA